MRYLLVVLLFIVITTGCATPTEITPTVQPTVPSATVQADTSTPEPPTTTFTETSVPSTETPTLPSDVTSFPDPAAYTWASFVSGLESPIDIQNAGDGSGRLYIVEKPGRIRIVENGQLLANPFLDITGMVGSGGSEQGLLGLAFHPDYKTNGYLFVNYTDRNGNTVIARFQAASPDSVDPATQKVLLNVNQPYPNHNGGVVAFGPDGYLYLGLGDGGSGGDPNGNGQSTNTLLGKILRLDVNNGDPYAIPADNPFVGNSNAMQEIWAYGLRNPWRFSFDKANGNLFIGDVGQNAYEEIDFVPAGTAGGLNFGWNIREGLHPFKGEAPAGIQLVDPVAEYSHGEGCSVTGGYVYRGPSLPEFNGLYLFGDYCSGTVWGLISAGSGAQAQVLFQSGVSISTFGVDEAGEIYLADYRGGTIYKLAKK
jgi:glucose/arabinose dehydrogenase